jgi:hypothetical protein
VAVSVVSSWANTIVSSAVPSPAPNPAAQSLVVPVANSGLNNNWLFAVVAWAAPNPYTTTVAVGDDAGNLWEPLGAPNGTSSPLGNNRTAIWYARNARAAANVFVSPTGYAPAINCVVAEVNGLGPWASLTGITTAFANAATTLGVLGLGYPPASVPLNQNTLTGPSLGPWGGNVPVAMSNAWGVGTDWSLMFTGNGMTANPLAASEFTIPVTAGTEYAAFAEVICPAGWPAAQILIDWYNASGTFIGNALSGIYPLPPGQGVLMGAAGQAPVGAVTGQMIVWLVGTPPANVSLFVTEAIFGLPSQALLFTASADDTGLATNSGGAWTGITGAYSSALNLGVAWQVTSSPVTATWTAGIAGNLSGILAGVLVNGIAPTAASPTWPLVQAQAAFGGGATTPWDQLTWTGMTTRFDGHSGGRGKQYELDSIQAGTANWTWHNNDGALTPQLATSIYSPYVQAFTPVRLLVTWPPPPAPSARTYVVNRSFMERWPQVLSSARYQMSNAVSADVWATTTALLKTIARAEILQDNPYAYWPLGDPAGSSYASNLATANPNVLPVVQSKYGPGAGKYQFGVSASGLLGDPNASTWQQTTLATATQGYSLVYQDQNLPAVAGSAPTGVTLAGWFNVLPVAGQPAGNLALITVKSPSEPVFQVYIPQSGGNAGFIGTTIWSAGAPTSTIQTAISYATGNWFHVAVAFASTGAWTLYVNGVAIVTSSLVNPMTNYWVSWNGTADRLGAGQMWNGQVADAAIFTGKLPAARIASQYLAMQTAFDSTDTAGQRMERLLLAGQAAVPRCIPPGSDTVVGAVDIAGNACGQNLVNIAESANDVLSVNGAGYLVSLDRMNSYNLPVSWYFGEQVAQPLNQNWSFETGVAPWVPQNGATLSQSALWSMPGGQHSALFHGDGSTSAPSMQSENVPVTEGTYYDFNAQVYSPQGWATGGYFFLQWESSPGVVVSFQSSPGQPIPANVPTGTLMSFKGVRAPAGATSVVVWFSMSGTPASSVQCFVDLATTTTTYTEQPYLADFASDYDPSQVFNDVLLSQLAASQYLSYAYSATTSGSLFTAVGSSFVAGQQVVLSGVPGGFVAGALYYVINVAGQSFQLSATSGGAAVTVTGNGSGTISGVTAATGVTVALTSPASILQYGDQTLQQTAYLRDTSKLTDLAYWIINTLGTPDIHIATLTLDPSANPALWPVVLGLETGQVVWVNRRLGGTYDEISGYFQVMSVAHTAGPRTWRTVVSLLPYYGNVLTADDPERGVLIGNALGW